MFPHACLVPRRGLDVTSSLHKSLVGTRLMWIRWYIPRCSIESQNIEVSVPQSGTKFRNENASACLVQGRGPEIRTYVTTFDHQIDDGGIHRSE